MIVCFVCTANIARSPYAERRARMLADDSVRFISAGVPGVRDQGMDVEMAGQLRARGGDANGHVSQSLTSQHLVMADLVLTFEFVHHMRVLDRWPQHRDKVFGLRQFTDVLGQCDPVLRGPALIARAADLAFPNSMTWDVADPHRRGRRAAAACAAEIDEVLERIVPRLAGR